MHGLVRELALQVYKTICYNIFKLGNLLHSMREVVEYSKMPLLRPPNIKTTSLLRPVFASPKWYFPYSIISDIKTTSLMRPLLGSPKGGLNIGILLYFFILCPRKQRHTSHRCSTCMTPRRRCFTRPSSVVNGL